MHAPVVGRRGGGIQIQPRDEASHCHFVMGDFALSSDHAMMLQGGGNRKICPAGFSIDSGPLLQGGGACRNNNTVCNGSRTAGGVVSHEGKGGFSAQIQKNDVVAVPMSAEAGLFPADGYAGIGNISDIFSSPQQAGDPARRQDEHNKNKGNDLFLFDWPELGPLEDFQTHLRKLHSTFEIGSNYFDDPMWPSICSPEAQLVPSCHFDSPDSWTVANKPILLQSTVSVPDSTDQINTQQPSRWNKGRESPLNCSSSVEIEHFPPLSEADLLFCPFDDMLVPISSSIMCNDEIMSPSAAATLSGPDEFVSAYVPPCSAKKKPHATSPDMILDEMAGNPLEMYFPPLTTYEQPETPMSDTSSTQMHHQLLPEGCFAAGGGAALNGAVQLCSKGKGTRSSARSRESPEAAPVKQTGFQKLQEGMIQMDVETKTCIRDALYRLANSVEWRHCVDQKTLGPSGANRFKKTSSGWTETQGSPMDRSVAQLILQKQLHRKSRKTTDRVVIPILILPESICKCG